jgi:16S rRNA (guanine(966)-N(2))-methyltransferase RsmD
MRIIGGLYRGRRLRAVEGLEVRPTSDRLRETLFNVLAPHVREARFLDICAGSGAVGIEALSRGASRAAFIDRSRRACSVIEANLAALALADEALIITRDAASALKRMAVEGARFDIAFFDPPYASQVYSQVMELLGSGAALEGGAIVIVEHRAKLPLEAVYGDLKAYREIKQGESALTFFKLARAAEADQESDSAAQFITG